MSVMLVIGLICLKALVSTCFEGCGSGKYLSVNPLLYNIGADRCRTLTEVAREKDNEVATTHRLNNIKQH